MPFVKKTATDFTEQMKDSICIGAGIEKLKLQICTELYSQRSHPSVYPMMISVHESGIGVWWHHWNASLSRQFSIMTWRAYVHDSLSHLVQAL
ncbi:hypothetical protein TNCV_3213651 [Trichonephila clavipes]|nr:hypothetical protein TNCV_3213651 [Trichonephila clavipes]